MTPLTPGSSTRCLWLTLVNLSHTETSTHVTALYIYWPVRSQSKFMTDTDVLTWKPVCSSTATRGVRGGGETGEYAHEPQTLESGTSCQVNLWMPPSQVSFICWRAVLKVLLT